jgi:hypothetical protein
MKTKEQAAVQNIVLQAHLAGMLYVPPTRFPIPDLFACPACNALGFHAVDCLPPFGLRKAVTIIQEGASNVSA